MEALVGLPVGAEASSPPWAPPGGGLLGTALGSSSYKWAECPSECHRRGRDKGRHIEWGWVGRRRQPQGGGRPDAAVAAAATSLLQRWWARL